MGRVKVLQVIECGGPGGSGQQVAALCNALDPRRFEVVLVYAARPPHAPEEYRRSAPGAERAFHIPAMTREISPARDLAAFSRLYALFKQERPDVVHAHCSKAGFLARLAAWLSGVPRIYYSPRGYGFQMRDRGRASRWLYRALERSVSWIGEIIAVSPSEARLARELSRGPVHVIPDPYWGEPPAARERAAAGDVVVGACGRLTHARHPEAFVRLAQRLSDSRNGLRCVWIGDGELGPAVREMVRDMNLSSRFELTGWLPPQAARERLGQLDLLVHFSRWEGLPNAVIDAMAHGVAVVASDLPGNRDALGDAGVLVADEVELLERTLELIDDPERRRRLGLAARARALAEFSSRRTCEALEKLYSGS